MIAVGWKPFYQANWVNVFDLVVLHSSLLAFFIGEIPGNRIALILDLHDGVSDLLELPRAMRVLRCGHGSTISRFFNFVRSQSMSKVPVGTLCRLLVGVVV